MIVALGLGLSGLLGNINEVRSQPTPNPSKEAGQFIVTREKKEGVGSVRSVGSVGSTGTQKK
ncbi:MAG: hypothetical protein F6K39_18825 [Okeania sp. SIO3B3]|nr:hypothetical protein [Okeania sp. SIO3B3]